MGRDEMEASVHCACRGLNLRTRENVLYDLVDSYGVTIIPISFYHYLDRCLLMSKAMICTQLNSGQS
jgi:hypothetical protein